MKDDALYTNNNETNARSLKVLVLDIEKGFKEYEDVRTVSIKSKNYTVMIMLDYAPTIGDIDGSLSLLLESNEIYYEHVKGFYHVNKNEMTILITSNEANDD